MSQPNVEPSVSSPPASEETAQKVRQLEQKLESRSDELATAEAQRDELRMRLTETENRLAAERLLTQAGVQDLETAWLLLERRLRLGEDLSAEHLSQAVQRLLLDKPFLCDAPATASMPGPTRSGRGEPLAPAAQLAQAAQRAAQSGNRRDIAEYLRLRRSAAR